MYDCQMMENLEEIKKANIKVEVVTTSAIIENQAEIDKRDANVKSTDYRYDEFWCNELSLFLNQLDSHL